MQSRQAMFMLFANRHDKLLTKEVKEKLYAGELVVLCQEKTIKTWAIIVPEVEDPADENGLATIVYVDDNINIESYRIGYCCMLDLFLTHHIDKGFETENINVDDLRTVLEKLLEKIGRAEFQRRFGGWFYGLVVDRVAKR
ncbi:MAG: hypothetical protein LBC95_03080 [Candidatus Nomurabacteria bacterium]|jgi:hypothetical protein|nr:hypothetical protein [Candidatus Nomurabacteria bacterium]